MANCTSGLGPKWGSDQQVNGCVWLYNSMVLNKDYRSQNLMCSNNSDICMHVDLGLLMISFVTPHHSESYKLNVEKLEETGKSLSHSIFQPFI